MERHISANISRATKKKGAAQICQHFTNKKMKRRNLPTFRKKRIKNMERRKSANISQKTTTTKKRWWGIIFEQNTQQETQNTWGDRIRPNEAIDPKRRSLTKHMSRQRTANASNDRKPTCSNHTSCAVAKGVDSSSTSASCVGSNPTGVNLFTACNAVILEWGTIYAH